MGHRHLPDENPDLYATPKASVVRFPHEGQDVFFVTDSDKDLIQTHHRLGQFYEPEELAIIAEHFVKGSVFLDIGANVGNHSIYTAMFLDPAEIIPIEPNPIAYRLLEANVRLNRLDALFDLSYLGYGVSDKPTTGAGISFRHRNIGGGKIVEDGGDIELVSGDMICSDREIGFVKIDVEGMEMDVLRGIGDTLKRCQPKMFIEVDDVNDDAFNAWLKENDFSILDTFKRYKTNKNYLISTVSS